MKKRKIAFKLSDMSFQMVRQQIVDPSVLIEGGRGDFLTAYDARAFKTNMCVSDNKFKKKIRKGWIYYYFSILFYSVQPRKYCFPLQI